MSKYLKVLIIEDSEDDVLLILQALMKGGWQPDHTVITTNGEFTKVVHAQPYDIILCSLELSQFQVQEAIAFLEESGKDIPVIVLSDEADEEAAVEMMRLGASDYLAKEKLAKLPLLVDREVKDVQVRAQKREAEAATTNLLKDLTELKTALDQSALVSITDTEGHIVYINERFCALSGYSADELIGKDHRILISDEHQGEVFEQLWKTISSGQVWRGELKNKAKNGEYYWVDTVISPILNECNQPKQYLAIRSDITRRKQYEQELIAAKEAAEAASKAKSSFMANMSHEIRNPMNGIMGMSNMLSRTELNPTQRKYLSLIQLSSDKLLGIINEILDFSKIESGRVELATTEFKVDKFMEDIIMLNQNYAAEKELQLTYSVAACDSNILIGDVDRLRQILLNLIQNAIKFTDMGFVRVTVSGQRHSANKCITRFDVQDSGIGINPKEYEQLFKPFYQVDSSTTKKFEGTGLGLAIVKRLIEMMNGKITIESEPGTGSTFSVEIPFEIPEHAQKSGSNEFTGEAVTIQTANKAQTVLVVEDNAINRMHMALLLGDAGFDVKEASNGKDALEFFKTNRVDLVVIDGQMPVMDGFMAVKQMREIEKEFTGQKDRLRHVPIIALSGYTNASDKDKFYAAGVDDFVAKPVVEADLFDKINALMQGSL